MPPKTYAVLIGINYYATDAELAGCHNDVDLMYTHLRRCGVEEFRVLKDSIGDERYEKADCPTKSNIICAVKDAYARMGAHDTLIFHYSGHGSQLRDKSGDEKIDRKDECICPVDYVKEGVLIDDDLNKLLVQPLLQNPELRSCKLRCVFDSCHSGSVLDLPFTVINKANVIIENKNRESCDVVCFSGCKDPQTSADAQINGRGQGAATFALWSALSSVRVHASWMDVLLTMQQALKQARFSQVACLSVASLSEASLPCDLVLPEAMKQSLAKKQGVQPVQLGVEDLLELMRNKATSKPSARSPSAPKTAARGDSSARGSSGNSGR